MQSNVFKGKTVLISGAGSGIGRAVAARLSELGARLHLSDLNISALRQAASGWPNPAASLTELDVRDSEALGAWIRESPGRGNRLDYLFNNAGIGMAGEFRHMHAEDWVAVRSINLDAVVVASQEAFKYMENHGGGHIVNTASLLGISPSPLASLYSACKHGVMGLSHNLSIEGKTLGILCSAVCPGYIDTAIFDRAEIRNTNKEAMLSHLPWKLYPVEEAARCILEGVASSRKVIVFPAHARLSHRLWTFLPGLYARINERLLERHRKAASNR